MKRGLKPFANAGLKLEKFTAVRTINFGTVPSIIAAINFWRTFFCINSTNGLTDWSRHLK